MKTFLTEEQEAAVCEYYLYPHSGNDTCSFFHISTKRLLKILTKHHIEKHSKEIQKRLNTENTQAGMLLKYGVKCSGQMPDHTKKVKATNLARYGSETFTNREQAEQTCLKKYGVKNPQQNADIQNKTRRTMLAKYGAESNVEIQEIRQRGLKNSHSSAAKEKRKQTCLKKYGTETNLASPEQISKNRWNNLAKYGVESYTQTEECKEKTKRTCLEKYGVDCYAKTDEFKLKVGSNLETILNKSKQACLEKYGAEYYMQSEDFKQRMQKYFVMNHDEIQNKTKSTCLSKYGSEYYFLSDDYKEKLPAIKEFLAAKRDEIQTKSWATKLKNGTFSSSKPEDEFYEALVARFGAEDVFRQYRDARYPFRCDFYVKSLDAFVELNLSWTHGGHRFDPNSAEDVVKLDLWKKKAEQSKYYEIAIETWTGRDVRKFEAAEASGLRYHACYSIEEAYALLR